MISLGPTRRSVKLLQRYIVRQRCCTYIPCLTGRIPVSQHPPIKEKSHHSPCLPITGVPEITKSVNAILDAIQSVPPSDFDRACIFPIVLTGCMAPVPFFHDMLRSRCSLHNDAYIGGSFVQALGVMQRMWERREAAQAVQLGVGIDWRDVVRESWSSLFTV